MLRLDRDAFDAICALAFREYPLEMCGLISGPPGSDQAVRFHPCRNTAESAKVYTIDPKDHLRAELDADDHDREINGVVHSHTHSEPYPSPTDVAQAPDPELALRDREPQARCARVAQLPHRRRRDHRRIHRTRLTTDTDRPDP